ncbi:histone-lysine N-methyltransferase NSD2-like [Anneissia japonica]|uniref:histone-lysine N-methyltransferase NSD2-like n=1 Tax=Anneissia japonica TaxID=1529436 RepID=UPI0014255CB8|nr:histone-lysine N-methyltransferase NSD2-like [Anneissia japonica]
MGTNSSLQTSVVDTVTSTNVNRMNPGDHRNPLPPIPPLYSSVDTSQRQTYSPSGTHTMSSMSTYSQSPQGFSHIPVNPVPGPPYHKIAQPLHQQDSTQQPVYSQYSQAYSQGPFPPQSYPSQQYYPQPSGYQQPYPGTMHPMSQQYLAQPMSYQQPSQRYDQAYNRPFPPEQRSAIPGYPQQPPTTQSTSHPTVQHPVPQMATAQPVPYQPYPTYPPTSQNVSVSGPPSNVPPAETEENHSEKLSSPPTNQVQAETAQLKPLPVHPPDVKDDESNTTNQTSEEELKDLAEKSTDSGDNKTSPFAQKKETVKAGKTAVKPQAVTSAVATCPSGNMMPVVGFDEKPCEWLVGDLVWSKVSGHPWWPCMVAYDPNLGIYTRMKGGGAKSYRMYHVQFFGQVPERGWVSGASMRKFVSREQYDSLIKELVSKIKNKTDRQRVLQKNSLKPNRKPAWDVAVTECVRALPMSRHERKLNFTFKYEMPKAGLGSATTEEIDIVSLGDSPKMKAKRAYKKHQDDEAAAVSTAIPLVPKKSTNEKSQEEKEKTSDVEDSTVGPATTPVKQKRQYRKKPKVSEDELSSEAESPRKKKRGRKPQPFHEYSKAHWEDISNEHPTLGKKELYTILEEKWDALPEDEKAQYHSTKPAKIGSEKKRKQRSDDSDGKPLTPTKRSKRETKPSLKMQEADFDSIGFSPEMAKTLKAKEKQNSKEPQKETTNKQGLTNTGTPKAKPSPTPKRQQKTTPAADTTQPPATESIPQKDTVIPADVITYDPSKRSKKRKLKKLRIDSAQEADGQATESEDSPGVLDPTTENSNPASGSSSSDEGVVNGKSSSGAGASRKENVCQVCERTGELLLCEGSCCGAFHLDCIGLSVMPTGTFKCDECISGVHSCFICKKGDDTVKRCNVSVCGKFYHESCVKTFPQTRFDNRGFICPLHTCTACAAENPKNPKSSKGRLMRCVRCPTAYHYGDACIAAGSMVLASNAIVCSRHFQPIKTQKHHSHVSVSWCFLCSKGGNLLCCESCPAAFHPDCIGYTSIPEGRWFCRDCTNGKRPQYDDIVWVKVGNYRWWPGRVCIPRNVPHNIQEKPHQVGEFPVHFFGSNDYFWTHQARVFAFQEGDKGSRDSTTSKGIAAVFKLALTEATAHFKDWKAMKEKRVAKDKQENDKKPAPFKYIKVNKPVGKVQMPTFDISQCQPCECSPNMENPCGEGSDCLNRMLQIECHPQVCPTGEKCQNQRFQKRQYPDSIPFKTGPRGWGLMTKVDIKKGDFVNEYVGELVDDEECHRRIKKDHEENNTNFYFLTLDKDRIIDAGPKGNMSRFMNHCCWPNCETQKWTVNGDIRVGLFATKDIKAGSELNFNYNLDCLGNEKKKCECGADNCSGFIGVRAKTAAAEATEEKSKKAKDKKKKKKRKLEMKVKHEDFCFRCGEGGELIMCDRKTCPKAYHLSCLKLEKKPYGKWDCPWHHCDDCGKVAKLLCVICPNSYCDTHKVDKSKVIEGLTVCIEHSDEDFNHEMTRRQQEDSIDDKKLIEESIPQSKMEEKKEEEVKNEELKPADVKETPEVINGGGKTDKKQNESEKPSGKKQKQKKEKEAPPVKETKTVAKPQKGKRSKKQQEKFKEEKLQNLLQNTGRKSSKAKKSEPSHDVPSPPEKKRRKSGNSNEPCTGNGVHNSTSDDDDELGALVIDEEPAPESKKRRKKSK